jgi:glycosyltransferase involved in cell wall biosynthesis
LDLGEKTLLFSPLVWMELPKLFLFSKGLAAKIDRADYDMVFAHNSRYTQCPVLLRYLKTPSIYYCHEPLRFVTEPHPSWNGSREGIRRGVLFITKPAQRLLFQLESRNLKRASLILTNSFFTMENLYRCYGLRSYPCYQGVDVDRFRPGLTRRENFVLSVGQMNRWKGQNFLVESLGLLPAAIRPALYLVYNKCAESYKRHVDETALPRGVHVRHFQNIPESELLDLYSRAKLLVYAPIMEPFGFAPLEAMACGTPVVAVKEGGVRETVVHGETGLLTSRDPAEFAQAVSRLLVSKELCERFGKQGRQHVMDHWTWPRSARRLEEHMTRLKSSGALGADRH